LRSLEAAIERIASDEPWRKSLAEQALARARALTWPAGARAALATLEEAAA
jgi:glycosyltransferase involved in cell wall biosynthesis